jgi:hypothetical protein
LSRKPNKAAHHCSFRSLPPLASISYRRVQKGNSTRERKLRKEQRKLNQQKTENNMGCRNREFLNEETSSSSLSEALIFATLCFIGLPVDVHVKDGSVYSGIFHTASVEDEYGMLYMLCSYFHWVLGFLLNWSESFLGFDCSAKLYLGFDVLEELWWAWNLIGDYYVTSFFSPLKVEIKLRN